MPLNDIERYNNVMCTMEYMPMCLCMYMGISNLRQIRSIYNTMPSSTCTLHMLIALRQEDKKAITEHYRKEITQKIRAMDKILKKGLPPQFRPRPAPHTMQSRLGMQPISTIARSEGPGGALQLASVPKCVEDDLRSIAQHWHTRALQYRQTSECLKT